MPTELKHLKCKRGTEYFSISCWHTHKHSRTLTGTDQLPSTELHGQTLMAWPMVEQFWSLQKCSSGRNYSPQHDKKFFRKVLHNQLISEMKNANWMNLRDLGRTLIPIAFCGYLLTSLFPQVWTKNKTKKGCFLLESMSICVKAFLLEKAQSCESSFPFFLLNPVNFQASSFFCFLHIKFLIKLFQIYAWIKISSFGAYNCKSKFLSIIIICKFLVIIFIVCNYGCCCSPTHVIISRKPSNENFIVHS